MSWKFVQPLFCNAAKRHGFHRKSGKYSCVQGVKWNILKMFLFVPCIKSHLPWKFHEYPFSRFFRNVANSQTTRQTDKPTDNDENITTAEEITFPYQFELPQNAENYLTFHFICLACQDLTTGALSVLSIDNNYLCIRFALYENIARCHSYNLLEMS